MRPLSELTARARDLRGLFCDLDDTLTHDGALVPEAYAHLCQARAAGLRVVPVTGRPAGWAAVLAATWPVDAVIAENGAVAFIRDVRGGRPAVRPAFWSSPDERARLAEVRDAIRADVLAAIPEARLAGDQWQRLHDLAFDVGETCALAPERVDALCRRIEAHGARTVVSTVHAHAVLGDYDKARMCERLARELWSEDLSQTREQYLFVGDSPNDQPCFAYFPCSVGVANVRAFPALEPKPAYVTPSPGGHGFAEALAHVLRPG